MPLITCPDCENEISDHAQACPHCGRPMKGLPTSPASGPVPTQTVEATGKKWKAIQLVGIILTLLGLVTCMTGMFGDGIDPEQAGGTAGIFYMIGLPLYILGRVGAWWYHK